MSRTLRTAAATLAALGLLTACGSSGSSADAGGKSTITFWDNNAGPARTPLFQHLIDEFEKANPNITVKYVGVTSSEVAEKYNTAIASNSTPDVGGVTTALLASLTAQKALAPLDERYAKSPLNGKISANFLATSKSASGGKGLFQLPSSGNQDVLWYRTDKFKAANLTAPKTWDELFADAAKLTDKSKNQYGFTIRGGSGSVFQVLSEAYAYSGISSMFDANGRSTVDDPKNVELIEKIVAQYKNTTPEADVSNAYPQMLAQFQANQTLMVHHNLGSTKDVGTALGDKVAGTLLPAGPSGSAVLANPVDGFGLFKNSKHQDAAWKFIEFLDSHESNSYWNQNVGQIPANTEACADEWYTKSGITKQAGDLLNAAGTKLVQPPVYLPQYSKITKTDAEPNFQKVLLGKLSAADFAKGVADAFTKAQSDYKAKNG
ncbi:sugar ABC transporter substrate-binding protein [Kitasatospora atroaurantiaca]|uniref:Carbohydrate ABC transporter substrate-binding protein (CUT1 family) n=1 Tax=Kitasatospora atroaurantiaca TaxID=285545 RepID=A0A561EKN7_9ACTN|nr:sugar ABC transporter substrate-binding protein [Kitasatospora atroaurantiaca]TWE16186.1 carbohydrate ABC transporter substrate-binding protein (CUT1 family) [Kitasatospora atroaurantiaca]